MITRSTLTTALLFSVASLAALAGCKGKETAVTTTTSTEAPAAPSASPTPVNNAALTKPAQAVDAKLGLKPGEEFGASCEAVAKDSQCQAFLVTDPAKKANAAKAMQSMCKTGTIQTSCPGANVLGACRVMADMIAYYYTDGAKPLDLAKAKADCTKSHGHWVE